MNGDSGRGSGGSSGFIPRARTRTHANTHTHTHTHMCVIYTRAEDTAAAEAHVKSNSPARAAPGRPAGLTVLGTRDYIKYVPNHHAGATAEEAPADYSLSDSGGGGVIYPPLDGRAAEQHLPPHAARRRPTTLY